MKFEPSHKLTSGFSYISFATIILLVAAFMIIFFQFTQKPSEPQNIKTAKNDSSTKKIEPAQEPIDNKKSVSEEKVAETPVNENSIVKNVPENKSEMAFELDFGGKAIRKIKSYLLPEFDLSEKGELITKLNFTIKPDGSVAKIYPVKKTNSRNELNSIFAMREWRFEALKKSADQIDQPAIITFNSRR